MPLSSCCIPTLQLLHCHSAAAAAAAAAACDVTTTQAGDFMYVAFPATAAALSSQRYLYAPRASALSKAPAYAAIAQTRDPQFVKVLLHGCCRDTVRVLGVATVQTATKKHVTKTASNMFLTANKPPETECP